MKRRITHLAPVNHGLDNRCITVLTEVMNLDTLQTSEHNQPSPLQPPSGVPAVRDALNGSKEVTRHASSSQGRHRSRRQHGLLLLTGQLCGLKGAIPRPPVATRTTQVIDHPDDRRAVERWQIRC